MDCADNIFDLTLSSLNQITAQTFGSIYVLENCPSLSSFERKHLNCIKLSILNTQRLHNTLAFLRSSNSADVQKIENYDIEPMIKDFLSEFERMSSGYAPLSVRFISRLKTTRGIALSKIHFEFIMLNLLYCCIKPVPNKKCNPVKITVSVSETKDDVVFHVYDNSRYFNPNELKAPSQDLALSFAEASIGSAPSFMELSLRVVQKSAADMNGRFAFSTLKSCNRYDIYLPKVVDSLSCNMCSPVRYIPTYEYFHEMLADIKLEQILTAEAEGFEGEFCGEKML